MSVWRHRRRRVHGLWSTWRKEVMIAVVRLIVRI